jgi:hypothetical protein
MTPLGQQVVKVRSKNAGPFWVTIDIFCGDAATYARIVPALDTGRVAALYATPLQTLKRFDIPDLYVIKFSLPRPVVQGSREDRDMHGAQWAALLEELPV